MALDYKSPNAARLEAVLSPDSRSLLLKSPPVAVQRGPVLNTSVHVTIIAARRAHRAQQLWRSIPSSPPSSSRSQNRGRAPSPSVIFIGSILPGRLRTKATHGSICLTYCFGSCLDCWMPPSPARHYIQPNTCQRTRRRSRSNSIHSHPFRVIQTLTYLSLIHSRPHTEYASHP